MDGRITFTDAGGQVRLVLVSVKSPCRGPAGKYPLYPGGVRALGPGMPKPGHEGRVYACSVARPAGLEPTTFRSAT